jgi:hypothetical protein
MNVVSSANSLNLFEIVQDTLQKEHVDIVLIPNKNYLKLIQSNIPQGKLVNILMFENLSLEGVVDGFEIDEMGRNETFAVVREIVKHNKIVKLSDEDVGIFARSFIGELPSLVAHGLTPDAIVNKIPARISMWKELNIQLLIAAWRSFDQMLETIGKVPYYIKQAKQLTKLAEFCEQSGKKLLIIGDGGRAAVYNNFITEIVASRVCGSVVLQSCNDGLTVGEKKNITKFITQSATESEEVVEIVKHAQKAGLIKIAIISIDNTLNGGILQELKACGIVALGTSKRRGVESILIRILAFIINKNVKEILPCLKISNDEKLQILNSVVKQVPCAMEIWKQITELSYAKLHIAEHTGLIRDFIKHNLHNLHCNEQDFANLQEFTSAFLKEIKKIESFGIKADDGFFHYFLSSWKVWEEGGGDVASHTGAIITSLEDAYFGRYDAVILTSKMKKEEGGNVIFSPGLRKYFGFEEQDLQETMLAGIVCQIFCTKLANSVSNSEISIVELKCEKEFAQKKNKQAIGIAAEDAKVYSSVSASALETLISSPETFYYKYIKYLRGVEYNVQESLEIGSILHHILEIATQNAAMAKKMIAVHFKNYQNRAIFYQKPLFKIIDEIEAKIKAGIKIEAEKKFEITIGKFVITARCDRLDTSDGEVVIYDYKSGTSASFTKSSITKKFEKIQTYIPAIALFGEHCNIVTIYSFLQNKHNKDISTEITYELLNAFQEFACDILNKYLFNLNEFALDGTYYNL